MKITLPEQNAYATIKYEIHLYKIGYHLPIYCQTIAVKSETADGLVYGWINILQYTLREFALQRYMKINKYSTMMMFVKGN